MLVKLSGTTDFSMLAMWEVPSKSGVYLIHDLNGVHYVGKSVNIRNRFEQHLLYKKNIEIEDLFFHHCGPLKFSWIQTNMTDELEEQLVRYFNPRCNRIKFKTKGVS